MRTGFCSVSMSSHQSAKMKSADWLTPPEWIEKLGPFDLDPCCPPKMPWPTASNMIFAAGGLEAEWIGRVWLNPPFGRQAAAWISKLAEHNNGIALIPARTETAMFYESVWPRAASVCFVRGRPHFHYPDGKRATFNSGAPIALVAYGENNTGPLVLSGLGVVYVIRSARETEALHAAILAAQVMTVAGDREAPEVNAALGVTAGETA
jgi:hypothetical protein